MTTAAETITNLGFRSTAAFQRAWALGEPLAVDGALGPRTASAANVSRQRHLAGNGDLSAHFSAREFRCACGGHLAGCQLTLVLHQLLGSLEHYRAELGGPLKIVSGYRCPLHNKAAGGASASQHLYGAAADVPPVFGHVTVAGWHSFAGIGWDRSSGRVVHVDRRDVSGHNSTRSSVGSPSTWIYQR